MIKRAEIEIPTLTPTFALSDSVELPGRAKWVEVAIKTVVGIIPEVCLDVIELVVELGNVGVPWTSVIAASVRRSVGTPDVGRNHGVRLGDMTLPSCC
jgi:hypothetical protein